MNRVLRTLWKKIAAPMFILICHNSSSCPYFCASFLAYPSSRLSHLLKTRNVSAESLRRRVPDTTRACRDTTYISFVRNATSGRVGSVMLGAFYNTHLTDSHYRFPPQLSHTPHRTRHHILHPSLNRRPSLHVHAYPTTAIIILHHQSLHRRTG